MYGSCGESSARPRRSSRSGGSATRSLLRGTPRSAPRRTTAMRSLRFQLPALFLLGIVVAGLVSAAIALRLFRSYAQNQARQQAYAELGREAQGLTRLYGQRAGMKLLSAQLLELATGDRIFYRGLDPFPGQGPAFSVLPQGAVDSRVVRARELVFFVFRPPGGEKKLLAAARPLQVGRQVLGTIVVAKPETVLQQRWLALIERLLIAFAGGVLVAAAFAWYLSRRITSPVLQLSRAADQVAGGSYDVEVPSGAAGEIGVLADRFREMAARLGEALREGVVSDDEMRLASLTVIAAEAERLERLVGDVLDLAKLDARRFTVLHEEVDMGRLVDRAFVTFGEEARRRGIDYRCAVDAKPVIVTDGDRVLQIISNLLSNAFRWTPDGGSIELELKASNGTVCVAVDDSGPGIPAGERERIFRPFWSRDGGGTGLGLAIARELAAALGGEIRLKSLPEQGSRFELVLPAEPE